MATGVAEHANPGEVTTFRGLGTHVRNSIVIIKIGPDSVPYHVHKSLLSHHSAYFDRAFKGNWREAEDGVVTLEDVDCSTFDIFVHWLYTQRLPEKRSAWIETQPCEKSPRRQAFELSMIRLRVFADRFIVSSLSQIMECILSQYLTTEYAFYEVVAYAYDHLPADSMILKAMIHSHCFFYHTGFKNIENGEINKLDKLPREFVVGTMLRYMELKQGDAVDELVLSKFHKHSCDRDTSACELAFKSLVDDLGHRSENQ